MLEVCGGDSMIDIEAEFARRKAKREAEQSAARVCKRCGKALNGAAHYRGSEGPFCWDHSGLYGRAK